VVTFSLTPKPIFAISVPQKSDFLSPTNYPGQPRDARGRWTSGGGAGRRKGQFTFGEVSHQQFIKNRDDLPDRFKPFVTPYSESDYVKMGAQTYMTPNGKAGYALTKDKDLISVFSKQPGLGGLGIVSAIRNGAKTLDCYDGKLPQIYRKFGFREKNRGKWDKKLAPKDWDYGKFDSPDVVFMEFGGGGGK